MIFPYLFIKIDQNGHGSDDDDVIFVAKFRSSNAVASNMNEIDTVVNLAYQTLEIIATEYNNEFDENHTDAIVVRPWLKGDVCARKPCIDTIIQFALYKCMFGKCFYATNSMEFFRKHMEMHDQVIDHFKYKNFLDNQIRDKLIKFRECAYCHYASKANYQLIEHMENVHRRCIFQCPQCFYRTIEVDNMLLHQKTYHPTDENVILLCGEKRAFQKQDVEILEKAEQHVKKIICGQGKSMDHRIFGIFFLFSIFFCM